MHSTNALCQSQYICYLFISINSYKNIYNVLIRNVNHIIVDDSVFEGNFVALKGFITLKIADFFSDKKMEDFVYSLKKI